MGASNWYYFVPYQSDINKALQELRQQVYNVGDYYKSQVPYDYKNMTEAQIKKEYGGWEDSDALIHDALYYHSMPEPTDPDSLVVWNREEGTHSIIDIERTSDTPNLSTAAPLPEETLLELFGTVKPNHAQVDAKKAVINELRSRWHGTYIVVYKNDEPDELFFTGFSGD